MPHDGSDPATGMVEIHADVISIDGTLNASGAGFTGGGGGGGSLLYGATLGSGGLGAYPDFDGADGVRGAGADLGHGGDGHAGDGFAAGATGIGGSNETTSGGLPGSNGGDGGYAAPGINGDLSIDTLTRMGSGGAGGGGGGGRSSSWPGGGGGAGGSGGGAIRLMPESQFHLGAAGRILADGVLGGDGETVLYSSQPGDGGWVIGQQSGLGGAGYGSDPNGGGDGGDGGAGAGGGVLLDLTAAPTLDIAPGALVESLGGHGVATNGGTVKISYHMTAPDLTNLTIQAGRVWSASVASHGIVLH
jgi:hypothetical protein